MSDRKYRQRGYQDEDRPQRPASAPKPAERAPGPPRDRVGPRTYNMPGYREVVRCARCGHIITTDITAESCCPKCGTDLHACVQCVHFDTGQRFQCVQTIAVRPPNLGAVTVRAWTTRGEVVWTAGQRDVLFSVAARRSEPERERQQAGEEPRPRQEREPMISSNRLQAASVRHGPRHRLRTAGRCRPTGTTSRSRCPAAPLAR